MLYKVGGYAVSFELARHWVMRYKPERARLLDDVGLVFVIEDILKEKGIGHWMWPTIGPDLSPGGEERSFVLLVRKGDYDSSQTLKCYTEYEEDEKDKKVKALIVAETESTDEDVKWVTIPDPFFQDPSYHSPLRETGH